MDTSACSSKIWTTSCSEGVGGEHECWPLQNKASELFAQSCLLWIHKAISTDYLCTLQHSALYLWLLHVLMHCVGHDECPPPCCHWGPLGDCQVSHAQIWREQVWLGQGCSKLSPQGSEGGPPQGGAVPHRGGRVWPQLHRHGTVTTLETTYMHSHFTMFTCTISGWHRLLPSGL